MGLASRGKKPLRRNPMILTTTQKEPVALYIPKSVIKGILFLIIGGGLIYFFILSQYFKIDKIIYQGNISQEAKEKMENYKGRNILVINNFDLATQIKEAYPQAYSVSVYKGLPNVLKVVTTERTVAMIWQSNGKDYLVDQVGVAFREVDEAIVQEKWSGLVKVTDGSNFPVTLGKRLISTKFIEFVAYVHNNFASVTGVKLTQILVQETSFHPVFVTELGWRVILDGNRSASYQLEDLKKIIDKHKTEIKEYVDLRTEGYGYWK